MVKEFALFARGAAFTRPQFRTHYEETHVPMAMRHWRTFAKYTRNYVVHPDVDGTAVDCVTEIWYASEDERQETIRHFLSEAGTEVRDDDARLFTAAHSVMLAAVERLTYGPPRGVESTAEQRKRIVVAVPASGATAQAFSAGIDALAQALAELDEVYRVTVDTPTGDDATDPRAFVSAWLSDGADWGSIALPSIEAVQVTDSLDVEQVETPADVLRGESVVGA